MKGVNRIVSKFIRLEDVIASGELKSLDEVDLSALLSLENAVELNSNQTGMSEIQKIQVQDLNFVAFNLERKRTKDLFLVGIGNRETKVSLRGYTAVENFPLLYKKICDLYTNWKMGIKAFPLREKHIKTIFQIEKNFNGFKGGAYTQEETLRRLKKSLFEYGIRVVKGRKVFMYPLSNSEGKVYTTQFNYCPIIKISNSSKIRVIRNSKQRTGKWKLVPSGLLSWIKYW